MSAATLERMVEDLRAALVAVAHGSPSERGDAAVVALVSEVTRRRPDLTVRIAYLNHAKPSVSEALVELAVEGVRRAVVLPLLLHTGYHATTDIEKAVAEAAALAPDLEVQRAGTLGPDRRLIGVVMTRLQESAVLPGTDATVVLAAAGGSDQERINQVAMTADLMRADGQYAAVEIGFVGGAEPALGETLESLAARGVHNIAVVPYLLGDGFLTGVVRKMAEEAGAAIVTAPLGSHPEVIDLIVDRHSGIAWADAS